MQVIQYDHERMHLDSYGELVRTLYAGYPRVVESKILEAEQNFDRSNPFHQHGRFSSFLLLDGKRPLAHLSAIMDRRLPENIGLFGHFECVDDIDSAKAVFHKAQEYLISHGKTIIRGPVNFTTWRNFRVSYPEEQPPFFIEPYTRSYYRELWKGFGFDVAQCNVSTIEEISESGYQAYEADYRRLKQAGLTFESMKEAGASLIVKVLHELTREIFSDTWSFVPIELDEFSYSFNGILKVLDGDFIYLAKNHEALPIGFCFAIPDYYSGHSKRLIIKTIGILPSARGYGIGKALLYLLHNVSCEKNISQFIFSTMRSDNIAMRNLAHTERIYRHYEVYELTSKAAKSTNNVPH